MPDLQEKVRLDKVESEKERILSAVRCCIQQCCNDRCRFAKRVDSSVFAYAASNIPDVVSACANVLHD
jgi:hypothetical protein